MSRVPGPLPAPLLPLLLLLAAAQGVPTAPAPTPRPNATRPVFPCGGDLRGDSGYVASEGFPRPYPPGRSCTWDITVPEGQRVLLTFRLLDLEPDPRCRFDRLAVFGVGEGDGQGAGEGTLLGRFCGTFRPGPLLAPGNRLRLRMESDGSAGGRGFLAWFSARPATTDQQQLCGGRLEKPQGNLQTPNWPEDNYPPGISCSWTILAPPGKVVELKFGKFDVEPDGSCRYDYVAVFEGGEGTPPAGPIVSSGRELLVQFVSDLSVTGDGFSATYRARDPPQIPGDPLPKQPSPPPPPPPPPSSSPPCPQRCRRGGTLQSSFCSSDFVLTGTVKSLTRGPPPQEGGGWAVVSVLNVYKAGGLGGEGATPPQKGASLRLQLPCRLCPALKKGSSYVLMGRVGEGGGGSLPPDSFVVPFRQQQQQLLGNLSKRPCRGGP